MCIERNDRAARCFKCGWTFTVHEVPNVAEYRGASWFCPHCGQGESKSVPLAQVQQIRQSKALELLKNGLSAGVFDCAPNFRRDARAVIRGR